jgi:putative hydrolase of the HAD superfamily
MPHPIQGVLFDYGLVLTAPPDPAAWARIQQITGLDHDVLSQVYWAHRLDYDRGHHTGREYWQVVGRHARLTLSDDQLTALLAADTTLWTQVNRPMADWAARLQAAGTPTGILSNLGDEMMHGVLATLPWIADFQHHLWSHTLKMAKPQPEIYLRAAQGLGLAPTQILFVDDREDNIAGAVAIGMQAIRYPDQATFEQEMHQRGLTTLWHTGRCSNGTHP